MVIMKFGGTSVGDPDAIRRMVAIVARETRARVVVVSALAGVTDDLLALARLAAARDRRRAAAGVDALRARHTGLARGLGSAVAAAPLTTGLEEAFAQLERTLDEICAAGEAAPRVLDAVAVQGEILSSRLAAAALQAAGVAVHWVNACDVVATGDEYTEATPDLPRTRERLDRAVRPVLKAGKVPVMGGFIGSAPDGSPTTLGRGGSDYSAALVGAALEASEIQIWTDVDGILTADPRLVPDARPVPHLSYAEALELACFGAKVLHPGTVGPAVQRCIPVKVLNARRPKHPGTRIDAAAPLMPLTALACKDRVIALEVRSRERHRTDRLLASVLDVARRHRLAVVQMSASEAGVSLFAEAPDALEEVVRELSRLGDTMTHLDLALVCLVGDNLGANTRVARQVLDELQDLAPAAIAQPTSRSVTVAVPRRRLREAANRLHHRFFDESRQRLDLADEISSAAGLQVD